MFQNFIYYIFNVTTIIFIVMSFYKFFIIKLIVNLVFSYHAARLSFGLCAWHVVMYKCMYLSNERFFFFFFGLKNQIKIISNGIINSIHTFEM